MSHPREREVSQGCYRTLGSDFAQAATDHTGGCGTVAETPHRLHASRSRFPAAKFDSDLLDAVTAGYRTGIPQSSEAQLAELYACASRHAQQRLDC
jgi:hypothetical protein